MGDLTGNGAPDELPVREVELSGYHLSATEVTQLQWQAVMGNNPSHFKGGDRPVETVTWQEALSFCVRLSQREQAAGRLPRGWVYTLPTEAQWENACRAGTQGDYAGDRVEDLAWYDENSAMRSHPVAGKKANPWGFHDMHGNLWEWCLDYYADNFEGLASRDPEGPANGSFRVLRGGSWSDRSEMSLHSSSRSRGHPAKRFNYGFRVAVVREKGGRE